MATKDIVEVSGSPEKDAIDCDSSNKTVEPQPGENETIEGEGVAVEEKEETELAVQDANVTSQPQPEIQLPTENDDVEEMQTETSTNDVILEKKEDLPDDIKNIPLEDLQVVDEVKDGEMNVDKQNVEEGKEEKETMANAIYPLSEHDIATPEFEKLLLLSLERNLMFRAFGNRGRVKKGALLLRLRRIEDYSKVQALVKKLTCKDDTKPKLLPCPPGIKGVYQGVVDKISRDFPVGGEGEETVSVFVNNLPKTAGQEVLHFLFPTALSVQLPVVMESAIQGYAIVEFASLAEARYMIWRNIRFPSKIGENRLRLHVIGHDEAKEPDNNPNKQARRGNKKDKTNKDTTPSKSTQSSSAKVSPRNQKEDIKVVGQKRKPTPLFSPAKKMKTNEGKKELPHSGDKKNVAKKMKKDVGQKESAQSGDKKNESQKTGRVMPPKKNVNSQQIEGNKNKRRRGRRSAKGNPSGKPLTNRGPDSNRAPVQRNSAGNKPNTSLQKRKANVQGYNSRNSSFGSSQQRKRPLPVQSSNNNRRRRRSSASSLPMNSSMQHIGYSSGSQPLRPNYNSISPNFISSEQLRLYQHGISGFPVDIGQRNLGLPGPYNTGTPRSNNTGARGAYRNVSPPPYYNTGNVVDPYNRGTVEPYVLPRSQVSSYNAASQRSSYDAGIQRSISDAEIRRPFSDAGTRRPSFDAGIQRSFSDAETQRPFSDAETRRLSFDAGSRRPFSDAETRRSFSDAETRRPSFDAGIKRSFSDAETQRSFSDAETGRSFSDAETRRLSFDAGIQRPFSDTDTRRSFSDAETQRSFSDAETRSLSFDAGIQRPFSDAGIQRSFADAETRRSSNDVETRRSFSDAEARRPAFDAGVQRSFSDAETRRSSYDAGIQRSSYNTGTQGSSYNTGTQELSYSRPTILAGDPYSNPSTGRTEVSYNTGSGVRTLDYNRGQSSSSQPMSDSYRQESPYIPRSPQSTHLPTAQSYQNKSSYSNLKSNHYPANTDFKKPANYSRARNSSDTSPRTSRFQAPVAPLNQALQSVASGTANAEQLRKLIKQLDQYERNLSGGDKTRQRNIRQQEAPRVQAQGRDNYLVQMRFCKSSPSVIKTFVNNKLTKARLCGGVPVRHVRKVSERDNDNAVVLQFSKKIEAMAAVNLLHGTIDRGSVLSLKYVVESQ